MRERGQKKGEDANKGAGGNITGLPRQESPKPGGRTKRGEEKIIPQQSPCRAESGKKEDRITVNRKIAKNYTLNNYY